MSERYKHMFVQFVIVKLLEQSEQQIIKKMKFEQRDYL